MSTRAWWICASLALSASPVLGVAAEVGFATLLLLGVLQSANHPSGVGRIGVLRMIGGRKSNPGGGLVL